MKFLFLFLVSFSSMASNWVPVSKIQSQSPQAHQLESECLKSGEQCLDIGDEPQALGLGFISLSDHYSKSDIESCSDEPDCQSKHESKQCQDGESVKNLDLMEVYCSKYLGKKIVKDEQGFNSYKSQQAVKAQAEALISMGAKADADCKRVLHLIGGFNLLPGRSSEQAGEMVQTFATAKAHLQDGRPGAAKAAIQAIPVDGVLVTQQMKDLALEQLKDW